MRSTRTSLAALAAMSMGLAGITGLSIPTTKAEASERTTSSSPAKSSQQSPGDAKAARLAHRPVYRMPVRRRGKAYSASVKQHQRHAAKARNRRR